MANLISIIFVTLRLLDTILPILPNTFSTFHPKDPSRGPPLQQASVHPSPDWPRLAPAALPQHQQHPAHGDTGDLPPGDQDLDDDEDNGDDGDDDDDDDDDDDR